MGPRVQMLPWEGAILRWKGRPIVKYRDTLLWAVQKWLNRSRCHLGYELWWANEAYIRLGPDPHPKGATIRRKDMPGHAQRHSAMSCAKMVELIDLLFTLWTLVGLKKEQVQSYLRGGANVPSREGTLAPPDEYDFTVSLRWRCGLMSNYFDHLLLLLTKKASALQMKCLCTSLHNEKVNKWNKHELFGRCSMQYIESITAMHVSARCQPGNTTSVWSRLMLASFTVRPMRIFVIIMAARQGYKITNYIQHRQTDRSRVA